MKITFSVICGISVLIVIVMLSYNQTPQIKAEKSDCYSNFPGIEPICNNTETAVILLKDILSEKQKQTKILEKILDGKDTP